MAAKKKNRLKFVNCKYKEAVEEYYNGIVDMMDKPTLTLIIYSFERFECLPEIYLNSLFLTYKGSRGDVLGHLSHIDFLMSHRLSQVEKTIFGKIDQYKLDDPQREEEFEKIGEFFNKFTK